MRKRILLFFFVLAVLLEPVKAQSPKKVYETVEAYYSQGKMDSALQVLLDFKSQISKDSGTRGLAYGEFLDQLATLYSVMRDPKNGLPVAYEVLNLYREIDSDSGLRFAGAMMNVVNLSLHKMELVNTEKQIDTALAIFKRALGDSCMEWINLMNSKGVYYKYTGQTDKALLTLLEVWDRSKHYYPSNHVDNAFYLVNISNLYLELGHYQKAKQVVVELERIFKSQLGFEHPLYVNALMAKGNLEMFTFEKQKAHLTFLEAKSRLGTNGTNSDLELYVDNNLAYTYYELKQFDTAIVLYKSVLDKWKKRGMYQSFYTGRTLINLGLAYFLKNDYTNAYAVIDEALSVFRGLNKKWDLDYGASYILKAQILFYQKDVKNAIKNYNLGLELNFKYWKYVSSTLAFNDQFNFLNYLSLSFDCITHNLELNPSLRKNAEALESLFKQQILLSNSIASIKPDRGKANPELDRFLKESGELKRSYATLYVSNPNAKQELDEIQRKIDLADLQINALSGDSRFQTGIGDFGYKDILTKLSNKEVLVKLIKYSYFDFSKKVTAYAALVFRKEFQMPAFELLGTEDEINAALLRKSAEGATYYNGYLDPKKTLVNLKGGNFQKYIDTYWNNVVKYIKPGNKVFFIPDGVFQKVALSAMPFKQNALMIDQTSVRVFYDFQSFFEKDDSPFKNDLSVGVWGGMDYNSKGKNAKNVESLDLNSPVLERGGFVAPKSWSVLKNSLIEVQEIAGLLNRAKVKYRTFSGKQATEESFKSQIGKWKILHLSTHGYSFGSQTSKQKEMMKVPDVNYTESWLKSGILFSGANTYWGKDTLPVNQENGVLTALEARELNLASTELVVISACETALGEEVSNSYLIGMPSALKMAGAKRLLLSLWNVPDKETKELIEKFYRFLLIYKSPHEALKAAQMELKFKYPPYFWAGFVLIE